MQMIKSYYCLYYPQLFSFNLHYVIAIYYLHVSQENKIQTIAASRDTGVFNFMSFRCSVLKKKGTSYESVTLVTQCIRPIYNLIDLP